MKIVPLTLKQAQAFIRSHHRHNKPPVGMKFAIGVAGEDGELLGVATAGRPVARALAGALEVSRTCTTGQPNANSMLYGAVRRAGAAMGYERIYTYTQHSESGSSLRAAGFRVDAILKPRGNWAQHSVAKRSMRDAAEPSGVQRIRWTWP